MSIDYTSLASGALGLTVALAWNEAVSKAIGAVFPPRNGTSGAAVRATFVYALAVTVLVVIAVAFINRARRLAFELGAKLPRGGTAPPRPDSDESVRFWSPARRRSV